MGASTAQVSSPQTSSGKNGPIGSTINQVNNQTTSQMPSTIEGLYQNVLGRQPDQAGADYWKQQFGDTVDANEYQTFMNAAQPELQQRSQQSPQPIGKGGRVTYPGQGGQPQIGLPNLYPNTVRPWDNARITPTYQNSKGKGA